MTIAALCSGLTAVRFAIEGRFGYAVALIILAAVMDGLDGRLARLLKSESDMGAELDSLCDLVNFGVAPALIIYLWALAGHAVGRLDRLSGLCGGLPVAAGAVQHRQPAARRRIPTAFRACPRPPGRCW